MKKRVIALIPARSGSVRVKNKNLQFINGIPLVGIAVIQARLTKTIEDVYVSTDSSIYAQVAENFGATVPFLRPADISDSHATDYQVFRHFLKWYETENGYLPEIVVQVRATAPVREVETIENCIQIMLKNEEFDSIRTVSSPHQTPYKMWRIDESGELFSLMNCQNNEYDFPTQALPAVYAQDGVIDIIRSKTVMEKHCMAGNRIAGYKAHHPTWDIDLQSDIDKASMMLDVEKLLKLCPLQSLGANLAIIQGRLSEAEQLQAFPNNWENEFCLARTAGYTAIELFRDRDYNPDNPLWLDNDCLDSVQENAILNGVAIRSICDDFVQNCSWINLTAKQYSILEDLLIKAAKIGCKIVVYPLMQEGDINDDKSKDAFVFYIKKLANLAKKFNLKIALEWNQDKNKTLEILTQINQENVVYCLDTGNIYSSGLRMEDFLNDTKMAQFIQHVHIKDRNNVGENVVLGTGNVDFTYVLEKLCNIGFCGTLVCETNRGNNPFVTAKNNVLYLKECWKNVR